MPNIYAPVSDVGISKKIPWIEVRDKHDPVTKLSELGYGQVKVWHTNRIAITAPETARAYGRVEDIMGSTE